MRAHVLSAVAAALCLSVAAPSFAQAPPPPISEARAAARALAERAFELYEAGKHAEAYQGFQHAEARFHAPPHILFMARCQEKLGKLRAARDLYQQVVEEALANYAPDEFRQAQAEARAELDALKKRIPTVQVSIKGATGSVRVTVDGAPLTTLDGAQPMDPGTHVFEAAADGAAARKSIALKEGARETVELDLTPGEKAAELPLTPLAPETPAAPEPGGDRPRLIVPAVAAFGVGALGLGIGAVTGAMSLGKVGSIKDTCTNDVCPEAQRDEADSAKSLGTVSTITFVIGGLGVATGAVLLVLDGRSAAPPAESAALRGATLTPRIGFGTIRLDGTF